MGHPNAEQVAQRAHDLELLDERQIREVWATLGSRSVPVNDLLQLLVRREYMTNYQVERLVKGERSGFFYGPYKVLYLVGSGSCARVFRASHRKTGAVVAIKALRTRYSENPAQFSQFVREGRVGCTLRHPNIVPIYEVVSEGKTHFLVMEFVEGWSLQDFVKIRKQVEPVQATKLMTDVTEGIRYAFEHGLTHRDLKLNNVLVSSSGQAKLVDFGLAAMDETIADDELDDLPNTRTIDYAALERATGVRKDDTRSDIYFLGCIFYHMLTGQAPLSETKDRLQRLSKQRFMEVVPIQKIAPTLPPGVLRVVHMAMSLDPTRRYQSPSEMLTDLHKASAALASKASAAAPVAAAGAGAARAAGPGEKQRSIMVVESNQKMQDLLRDGLKRAGYRVLLTSDPARAVKSFRQNGAAADCVLFAATEIGQSAVQGFNLLAEDKQTNFVRAILLLDENQRIWEKEAAVANHRRVLSMPITMKQLRTTLAELLDAKVVTG
jgi:serine/threonine-protein kinase